MFLEGEENQVKSGLMLTPVLVVNNDLIDVDKDSFDVSKYCGE